MYIHGLCQLRPCRFLFKSESLNLYVVHLHVVATVAVNSLVALSASSPELIWILREIISEERL